MIRSEHIAVFVEEIWSWYSRHKRTLPWRDLQVADDTQRAYMVLVSEVMLQQTQVPRVIPAFKAFLERFPAVGELAKATNADVIRQWKGMGYNNRAIRLRDAARNVMQKHGGVFPRDYDELLELGGIGPYTAGAVRNFAFGIPTPCIDTNIRRLLHRAFVGPENPDGTWKKDDAYLLKLAGDVLEIALQKGVLRSRGSRGLSAPSDPSPASPDSPASFGTAAAEWHAALMDFGSLVCTKRSPKWDVCPLTKRGVMLAAYKIKLSTKKLIKKEPGREIAGRFVPNRIIRGRVVDALREQPRMKLSDIGRHVCIDWSPAHHRDWLVKIVAGLENDGILVPSGRGSFALAD